jgi:hypothetical protein
LIVKIGPRIREISAALGDMLGVGPSREWNASVPSLLNQMNPPTDLPRRSWLTGFPRAIRSDAKSP